MTINWNLKSVLVRRFGSQVEAAIRMGIRENRLSYIVRGHTIPSLSIGGLMLLGVLLASTATFAVRARGPR